MAFLNVSKNSILQTTIRPDQYLSVATVEEALLVVARLPEGDGPVTLVYDDVLRVDLDDFGVDAVLLHSLHHRYVETELIELVYSAPLMLKLHLYGPQDRELDLI
jgi:hypothetical protein